MIRCFYLLLLLRLAGLQCQAKALILIPKSCLRGEFIHDERTNLAVDLTILDLDTFCHFWL